MTLKQRTKEYYFLRNLVVEISQLFNSQKESMNFLLENFAADEDGACSEKNIKRMKLGLQLSLYYRLCLFKEEEEL